MQEIDVFARIITDYGPPEKAHRVPSDIVDSFHDRLPPELLTFWRDYGWGEYKEGLFRICDPRPFRPLLEYIFRGDPEYHANELTVIAYTVFNRLKVWDPAGRTILIDLENAEVSGKFTKENPDTGKRYSDAFLIGLLIYNELSINVSESDRDTCDKLGKPGPDEVFGYAPALQLGGELSLDHLHRFKALEHMTLLAQIGPLTVTELTEPEPDAPLGRIRKVRRVGSQR